MQNNPIEVGGTCSVCFDDLTDGSYCFVDHADDLDNTIDLQIVALVNVPIMGMGP